MANELGAGLGDILSMALEQTGVESLAPPQISLDSNSILSAAADTLDSSLLSSDIGVLTEGLFSTLAMVKETPIPLVGNNLTTPAMGTHSELPMESTPSAVVREAVAQKAPVPAGAVPMSTEAPILSKPDPSVVGESLQPVAKAGREGVKMETQGSTLDDDIDLNEFLSVGNDVDANINHLSLLGMDVAPSVSASETSLQSITGPLSLPLNPPLAESDTGASNDPASSMDDLSSLLSITGSQYLESLDPSFIADDSGKNETNETKPNVDTLELPPLGSVSAPVSSPQPSVADQLHSVTTASGSVPTADSSSLGSITTTSLIPTATISSSPLTTTLPPLTTSMSTTTSVPMTPTPAPKLDVAAILNEVTSSISSSPLTTALLPLTTSAPTTTPVPVSSTPVTKLDVAAILNEVTQQVASSIAVSTSLTNSVSVTVVPSPSALKNIGQKTPTIIPLRGGLPVMARSPLALKGERSTSPLALQLLKTKEQHSETPQLQQPAEEESDDEDDQWSAANTYANYKPAKLKIGYSHPDPIVESSSLSNVEPPQVWFDLKLPSLVIEEVQLSSLQLEAVVYACQQHMNILSDGSRAGYLIGDGAGVGKGRTIAGIIYQNYLEGRKKAVWLSVSNDLKFDAMRDLRDVGAKKITVYSLNKFHYGKISGKRNGRVRKGVIFSTYSSLIGESSSGGKYRTRFNQLLHWLGPQFEGVIVFDECHKAKNLVPTGSSKPSKTGLTVLQLQKKLPKARIVYCSATGASEPRNMAYMSRLGIWGPGTQFPGFQDFIRAVERRGVGAMEIVAMDMKLRGMYAARQLSFTGVTFSIRDVPLADKFIEMYDSSVDLWVECKRLFQEAADLMDYDRKKLKTMWGQFWAAHQRFFKYLCIAAKVPEAIQLAKRGLQEGKCVVIGLQSTGEARTLEQLEQSHGELSGFISTAKGVLETLIKRHFPTPTTVGFDWNLFENDPTLPSSCRKRKRNDNRGAMFQDEEFSSDSDDSSSADGDSAVESSSDEGEGGEEVEEEEGQNDSDEDSGSTSSEDNMDTFNPFGLCDEPWNRKHKIKRRKTDTSQRKGNFSIKPPPSSGGKGRGKTKTGFNSRSLKFEPVGSPKEGTHTPLDRRQSIAVVDGLSRSIASPPLARKQSLQQAVSGPGEGSSLLNIMSNSAMSTGSNSSLRNVTVKKMKEELQRKLDVLSPHLPTNTLDELIDGLGGPSKVAEMTGRRGRVVSLPDGTVQYQLRTESDVSLEMLNLTEKQRFMDGEKSIAIISEAASSGISLQSDKRAKNHKRRVHITLELPWSADKAIQQFGRTHRSNQVNAPEYVFLISELAGEKRFASIVAKRLESLGALTHGDRRATESRDLSKYHVDTKYGRMALEAVLKSVLGVESSIVQSEEYPEEFFHKCRSAMIGVDLLAKDERGLYGLEKEATTMSRFLNRILGLPVGLQNQLFAYFMDTLTAVIKQARRAGSWDGGILDFGASGEEVEVVEVREYVGDPAYGTATTQLFKIQVERGLSFSDAVNLLNAEFLPGEGFYISKKPRNNKHVAVLLKVSDPSNNHFSVHRPNTGRQGRSEKLKLLQKKYTKVEPEEAEKWWNLQYTSSLSVCSHAFWQGRCKLSVVGRPCEVGLRRRHYYILSGSVLGVWTHLEGVFARHSGHNNRMQIARVQTPKKRLVGILVPSSCVEDLKLTLNRVAEQAAGIGEDPAPLA